jgi:hypothetical protein
VQQDGQEFFKLLLGFLEKEFDKAPDPVRGRAEKML